MNINAVFDLKLNGNVIDYDATVETAIKKLNETGARSLLVQDDQGRGVGVLSEHDLVVAFAEHGDDVKNTPINQFMTLDLIVAEQGADIDYVAKLMAEHNIRHLPVISDQGNVVSFLTVIEILMAKVSSS